MDDDGLIGGVMIGESTPQTEALSMSGGGERKRVPTASPDEIWRDDVLGRKADAELLTSFLVARSRERAQVGVQEAYVLNLNAPWGLGKTFFLERLRAHLQAQGHITAYVNGWRDDAGGEPLVAVLAALDATLRPHLDGRKLAGDIWKATKVAGGEALAAVGKGAVKRVLRKVIGDGMEELIEIYESAPLLAEKAPPTPQPEIAKDERSAASGVTDDFADAVAEIADRYVQGRIAAHNARMKSIDTFKAQMARLLKQLDRRNSVQLPMFILVDELDRCRPTYAIEMLEQIKHLFDVPHVVFVIATDSGQLAHSVRAVYGEGFASERYLARFFHRHFTFEQPDYLPYARMLFAATPIDTRTLSTPFDYDPIDFFGGMSEYYQLSLRDAGQCFDVLKSIASVWTHPVPIELAYLLPLICSHHLGDEETFEALSKGRKVTVHARPQPMLEYFDHDGIGHGPRRRVTKTAADATNSLAQWVDKPLPIITDADRPKDALGQWAQAQFRNELAILHRNHYNSADPPASLLRKYPALVRNLARLQPSPSG